MDWQTFLESFRHKLLAMGIEAKPILMQRDNVEENPNEPFVRRTVRICGKIVVGYPLLVHRLLATESCQLQEGGLGGRRHFGCGVFVPYFPGSGNVQHSSQAQSIAS
jgi:CRISPR-associated protein Cas6